VLGVLLEIGKKSIPFVPRKGEKGGFGHCFYWTKRGGCYFGLSSLKKNLLLLKRRRNKKRRKDSLPFFMRGGKEISFVMCSGKSALRRKGVQKKGDYYLLKEAPGVPY